MTASASNSEVIHSQGSGEYYGFTHAVSWSESNPSTSTNKSKISASASLSSSNTSFSNNYAQHLSVYWYDNNQYQGGVKIAGVDFYSCGMGYGTASTGGSIEVPHKDDGTLRGYCVSYFSNNNGGWYTPSDNSISTSSQNLETIARASTASADPNTVSVGSSGATVTINTNRKASIFTHSLTLTCGEWTATKTNIEDSTTFDIPYNVIAQFPSNSRTATCTISCITYNGSTSIGTKTSTFTLQTDTAVDHPNVGTVGIEDTNSRTSAVTQSNNIMISNISILKATIPLTVSGSYTQLASAVVTCGSMSQTYTLSGTSQTITFTFNKVNANSLKVVVTDARGVTATTTKSWTLIPYQSVTATATVGRESPTGSVGFGEINGLAYGGAFGATTNSLTINVDFKKHDDSTYDPTKTETYTLALSQSGYNEYGPHSITFQYALDYQYQYDIRFTVSDLFSTDVYTCQLMQGLPIMSWDETEVDIWGDVHIHDREDPYKYQDVLGGFDAVLESNGHKNLLFITGVTETINGGTFTMRDDGTIKVNGTFTDNTTYTVCDFKTVNGKAYKLTGCPSGGGSHTYDLGISSFGTDTGNGLSFTGDGNSHSVTIFVFSGQTVDVVFEPMIRDARIASDEFIQPYNKIKTVEFYFYNVTLNTYNGNTLQVTLPSDFKKSLGMVVREAWPNQNWNNGAIVTICKDDTLVASPTDAGTSVGVTLTTTSGQRYNITLWLVYISD